ncbi:MAG TPA: hypothetical protein VGS41_18565 [Chthonomonadales bacterium]|nr:hypothetical protein [Chthonomonadales bacterium]
MTRKWAYAAVLSGILGISAVAAGADPTLDQVIRTGYINSLGHFVNPQDPNAQFVSGPSQQLLFKPGINGLTLTSVDTNMPKAAGHLWGYYTNTSGNSNTLGTGPGTVNSTILGATTNSSHFHITPSGKIGLFLEGIASASPRPLFFSQANLNSDFNAGTFSFSPGGSVPSSTYNSGVHYLEYFDSNRGPSGVAYVGVEEDGFNSFTRGNGHDVGGGNEFQDQVVRIEGGSPVPEPQFLQLGVLLGGGGLLALRTRKRAKK